jgi:hypothetical protein
MTQEKDLFIASCKIIGIIPNNQINFQTLQAVHEVLDLDNNLILSAYRYIESLVKSGKLQDILKEENGEVKTIQELVTSTVNEPETINSNQYSRATELKDLSDLLKGNDEDFFDLIKDEHKFQKLKQRMSEINITKTEGEKLASDLLNGNNKIGVINALSQTIGAIDNKTTEQLINSKNNQEGDKLCEFFNTIKLSQNQINSIVFQARSFNTLFQANRSQNTSSFKSFFDQVKFSDVSQSNNYIEYIAPVSYFKPSPYTLPKSSQEISPFSIAPINQVFNS